MIVGRSLVEIIKESYTMQILLLVSIVALGFILERVVYFLRIRTNYGALLRKFETLIRSGKFDEARALLSEKDEPLRRVLSVGVDSRELEEETLLDLLESAIIKERRELTRSLTALATIAAIAPLLGLYGTVVGLIKAFNNIAITGSGGPEVVGRGIAEALLTTAFGLIIAVPVLIFYNYFHKKAQDIVSLMESAARDFLVMVKGNKSKV